MLARVAQRQAAQHPHLLLELRGAAGVDGEVAAVVRARGDFVDEEGVVLHHKKFHRHHPHIFECHRHLRGDVTGLGREVGGNARRGDGQIKNAVNVLVFRDRKNGDFAVIGARQHH